MCWGRNVGLIKKIQEKPELFRKKIFWLIMILIIIGAIFLFVQKMKQITSSSIQYPISNSSQTNIEENISEIKKGLGAIKGLFEELKEETEKIPNEKKQ